MPTYRVSHRGGQGRDTLTAVVTQLAPSTMLSASDLVLVLGCALAQPHQHSTILSHRRWPFLGIICAVEHRARLCQRQIRHCPRAEWPRQADFVGGAMPALRRPDPRDDYFWNRSFSRGLRCGYDPLSDFDVRPSYSMHMQPAQIPPPAMMAIPYTPRTPPRPYLQDDSDVAGGFYHSSLPRHREPSGLENLERAFAEVGVTMSIQERQDSQRRPQSQYGTPVPSRMKTEWRW